MIPAPILDTLAAIALAAVALGFLGATVLGCYLLAASEITPEENDKPGRAEQHEL